MIQMTLRLQLTDTNQFWVWSKWLFKSRVNRHRSFLSFFLSTCLYAFRLFLRLFLLTPCLEKVKIIGQIVVGILTGTQLIFKSTFKSTSTVNFYHFNKPPSSRKRLTVSGFFHIAKKRFPNFHSFYFDKYYLLSLKCKISVFWLVKTACIFLVFLIATKQISMECETQESLAG